MTDAERVYIVLSPDSKKFLVGGKLDFDNVELLLKQACEIINQQTQEIRLDFSQLEQSNSAGLALLTNLIRHAQEKNKNIEFSHLPANLWAAAKMSDLDKILPCTHQT